MGCEYNQNLKKYISLNAYIRNGKLCIMIKKYLSQKVRRITNPPKTGGREKGKNGNW